MSYPAPDEPLELAIEWLRERVGAGERCPCCTQFAKVYRRKINGAMTRALVALYNAGGAEDHVHTPDFLPLLGGAHHGGDVAKLRYWELVAELDEPREDGGRAGYWKLTPTGVEFLRGRLRVPKYALVYDGRGLGLRGDPVSISDCLGEPFHLDELMRA